MPSRMTSEATRERLRLNREAWWLAARLAQEHLGPHVRMGDLTDKQRALWLELAHRRLAQDPQEQKGHPK